MKTIMIFIVLVAFPSAAFADWSAADTQRETAVVVLSLLDMQQTLYIASHPKSLHETNPLLGQHPRSDTVYEYFAASIAVEAVVAYLLPDNWRPYYQCFCIAWEGSYVQSNFSVGVQISF